MSADPEYVSIREFARRDGCNEKLVRRAISEGKLRTSPDGKVLASQAGAPWRQANRRKPRAADKRVPIAEKSAKRSRRSRSADTADEDDDFLADTDDQNFIADLLAGRFRNPLSADRIKENSLAAKHLLAVRRAAGDVVDLEVAEAVLFEEARKIRDALMNWPTKVGPLIAAELGVDADPVVEALNKHVQKLVANFGEPDADWSGKEG